MTEAPNDPFAAQPAGMPTSMAEGLPPKPGQLTAVGILTLVSGVLNIVYAISLALTCIMIPVSIYLLIVCVFEIMYAVKLLRDPIEATHPSTLVAVLEIICIIGCNPIAMVSGILALIFYGDEQVKQYFRAVAASRATGSY